MAQGPAIPKISGTVAVNLTQTGGQITVPSGDGNLLADVNIVGVSLGPQLSEVSVPVTLALDQDFPIRATGQQPLAQSLAVSLASDHAALPVIGTVSVASSPLPPNAAQEAGGNLAAAAVFASRSDQLVDMTRLVLAELRAIHLQLASMTGVIFSASPDDDNSTLQ